MSKHTLGPWLVDFELDDLDSRSSILRVLDPRSLDHPQGPLVIANINAAAHAPHLDEPLHNARLIAAAPDLLDALIKARHYVSINRNSMVETCTRPDGSMHIDDEKIVAEYDTVLEQIDTALSKAT